MRPEHEAWIKANVDGDGYGRCHDKAKAMTAAFPELRYARGFFHCAWGARQHGWCVDRDGAIVDPTRGQFPGPGEYEEITEDQIARRVPSGVCMDCGAAVYGGRTFCSATCERATVAYLEGKR